MAEEVPPRPRAPHRGARRPRRHAARGLGLSPFERGPVHLLLNPAGAEGRAGRRWARLEPAARALFPDLAVHPSTGPGDLARIARELALLPGPRLLIAAGGDGTSHEVINGLVSDRGPVNPLARMAWLPLGSGNDLARALGFVGTPGDPLGPFRRLEPAAIDLGRVEWRGPDGGPATGAFGNSLTVGITTRVLRLVRAGGKPLGGRLAYGLGAVRALLRYRPADLRVLIDGREWRGPTWLVSITNGPSFGAGMRITPSARLDDGRLDVVRITGTSRLELLRVFPRVYWGGHVGHRAVEHATATAIRIETEGPADFEADGELYRGEPPFRITIAPRGLPIVRPRPPGRAGTPEPGRAL